MEFRNFQEWKFRVSLLPSLLLQLIHFVIIKLINFMNSLYIVEAFYSIYCTLLSVLFLDNKRIEWKTHWQSPVCHDILRRKFYIMKSKSALFWAAVNLSAAIVLFLEIRNNVVASWFGNYSNLAWYCELFMSLILTLNAVIALSLYTWSVVSKPMVISPAQKKLFRINDKDPGFAFKTDTENFTETPRRNTSLSFTSWREDFEGSSSCLSVTPLNFSAHSWGSGLSTGSSLDTTSNSWSFHHNSSNSFTSTPKSSTNHDTLSPLKSSLDLKSFPLERQIRNRKQLETYLKEYEEEEKKFKSMSFEESKVLISNVTSTVENHPMSALRKCRYQKACRLPHSEKTEDDSSEIYSGDNVWYKLKISDKMLTLGCENLRKWICQTILVKVVQEIEGINNSLCQMGLPEFQIGTVSLFVLHQIAVTKAQNLPTLSSILPYLDMHLNQKYLIRRLKDLAHGGCMGDFKWNSGGSYDNKQWCDDLPTDSAIVMHVLCCYFDAHLPPETHFPEGKPFTSKYLKKTPEKPVLSKETHYVYQSSINPPCYKVAIGDELYTLPKGRNNLFCTVLIFLHHIKTKECGMLGRVNLGPSGLNILWVLDW